MLYKRGKWYWMDAMIDGNRYRAPLGTKNWQEALHLEKEKIAELSNATSNGQWAMSRRAFNDVFDSYIESRKLHCAPRTYSSDKDRGKRLINFFGGNQLRQITAELIACYQRERIKSGVGGRTVNIEVGLLRRVLKYAKQWSKLADDVKMLPEHPKEARVLTPEEKALLIDTAHQNPAWQIARCAGVLALNTTMRSCELKGLRWKDINLTEKLLNVRRQSTKTNAGARVIPLNKDALAILNELRERSVNLNCGGQNDYIFPACENGYIDPSQPMKGWRTAWRSLTKKAGLKGLRFHDLRHQAVTELAEGGYSDQTIKSIAGHVSQAMLNHYSHIRIMAKRQALESLESANTDFAGSPGNVSSTPTNTTTNAVN